MIRLEFTPTASERAQARRLLRAIKTAQPQDADHASKRIKPNTKWIGWIIFIAMAVVVFLLMPKRERGAAPPPQPVSISAARRPLAWWSIGLIVVGIVLLALGILVLVRAVRAGLSTEHKHPATYEIDDQRISVHTPGKRVDAEWKSFENFAETDAIFLLRERTPGVFMLLSKRAMNADQLAAVRPLLVQKLVAG
jgi:hypothetical protein